MLRFSCSKVGSDKSGGEFGGKGQSKSEGIHDAEERYGIREKPRMLTVAGEMAWK